MAATITAYFSQGASGTRKAIPIGMRAMPTATNSLYSFCVFSFFTKRLTLRPPNTADKPNYYPFLFNQSNINIVLTSDSEKTESYKHLKKNEITITAILDRLEIPGSLQMQNVIAVWAIVHGLAGIVTMKDAWFDVDWDEMIEKVLSENLKLVHDGKN